MQDGKGQAREEKSLSGSALAERSANGSCRHHWIIPAPAGASSIGRCRKCGARHEFSNVFEGSTRWDGKGSGMAKPEKDVHYVGALL